MHMKYAPRSPDDIVTLIGDHPLCWIVSHSEAGFGATPLPLLAECNADGALVSLLAISLCPTRRSHNCARHPAPPCW